MMTPTRARFAAPAIAAALLLGAGTSAVGAATYSSTDLLFVAYQPHGRELVANIGPASSYTRSASSVAITQLNAADLCEVFGSPLPEDLRIAVVGADGVDGYFASNGPPSADRVGSALGASSQIRFLGGNLATLSRAVNGNAEAGYFEFGDAGSYQGTLSARVPGALGSNVSFNVETPLRGPATDLPFYRGRFNPFVGRAASEALLGTFRVKEDGTMVYLPARKSRSERADAATSAGSGAVDGDPVSSSATARVARKAAR